MRARVDGTTVALTDDLQLDRQMRHNIEVVIDRLTAGPALRARLAEAVELGLRMGGGNLVVALEQELRPREAPAIPMPTRLHSRPIMARGPSGVAAAAPGLGYLPFGPLRLHTLRA